MCMCGERERERAIRRSPHTARDPPPFGPIHQSSTGHDNTPNPRSLAHPSVRDAPRCAPRLLAPRPTTCPASAGG